MLKIGRLKEHATTPTEIQRLLVGAERNLADSRVAAVSDETRFDAAYKAVMQCALAAMMARGYRPSTSEPGHHQTMIQSLPLTLGVASDAWVVLDALRRKRNAIDYSGDAVDAEMVTVTTTHAAALLKTLRSWLATNRPDLLRRP
ncbi:MAG TPA: DNA-binding protein [Burkholderiaceae bacterium]|nr:DNA-binding protein [Burkholderiaceae bacterium]